MAYQHHTVDEIFQFLQSSRVRAEIFSSLAHCVHIDGPDDEAGVVGSHDPYDILGEFYLVIRRIFCNLLLAQNVIGVGLTKQRFVKGDFRKFYG